MNPWKSMNPWVIFFLLEIVTIFYSKPAAWSLCVYGEVLRITSCKSMEVWIVFLEATSTVLTTGVVKTRCCKKKPPPKKTQNWKNLERQTKYSKWYQHENTSLDQFFLGQLVPLKISLGPLAGNHFSSCQVLSFAVRYLYTGNADCFLDSRSWWCAHEVRGEQSLTFHLKQENDNQLMVSYG